MVKSLGVQTSRFVQGDVVIPPVSRSDRMKYTAADLQPLDPIAHIRANPKMYTGHDVPSPMFIAHFISLDALTLGASDVRITRFDDWWIVCADLDWLNAPCQCSASPRASFNRLLGFPELAANSMRHEILATAFAQCVVSLSTTDRFVVCGDVHDDDSVWERMLATNAMRSVALRMNG